MKASLPTLLALLLAALPATASAQERCSHETLAVRGVPVTIGYCVAQPPTAVAGAVLVSATAAFKAPGGSFTRTNTMRFITGEGPSRVLENVPLASLGLKGMLHLTLLYSSGTLHIESALLTPGAITIK
ncbi:MAG: hypothetical protein M3R51_04510 [Candidatus Eremiobacteraeota bacterium]|nr:hypothetical protein [Candidatus Eremiobacteraeota bacterium]